MNHSYIHIHKMLNTIVFKAYQTSTGSVLNKISRNMQRNVCINRKVLSKKYFLQTHTLSRMGRLPTLTDLVAGVPSRKGGR